uniref:coiled-coil domain-containing protein 9 isoform X2 n=1 Tax=Doryrhamphus excisus TaxID=161450 RepID=UPI0025AE8C37|nr:coiled-coil domain-containing protein 9 isoform X2 [Doryrhamphus excisus]
MSSAVDLKTKEEKDAELDKRIEALRKKNEALVKRYQEIEEDKKKAEQEGIAVTTPRKPRPHEPESDRRKTEKENFTLAVDTPGSSSGDARIVDEWKPPTPRGRKVSEDSDGHSPPRRTGSGRVGRGGGPRGGGGGGGRQERREREPRTPRGGEPAEMGGQGRRGGRRGRGGGGGGGGDADAGGTPGGVDRKSKEWEEKRRQNIEKMNEEMERIAEYERGQRQDGDKPIRNFLDDPRRSGPAPDTDRKEGSRRHVRNWGGLDFDNVKTGTDLEKEWTSRRPGPRGSMDMTMSMTGRERAEYLRWKKEREQIDEERLARHRNATGQWRREWDAQKTENMFKDDAQVAAEGVTAEQGGRRARGRNFRGEPRGRASDDGKRPPKTPTFGDFLSQGRQQGSRGDQSRGKGRGQKPSYSMHDNRWEGEKEDEETEKNDKPKREKTQKEKEKSKPPPEEKAAEAGDEEDEDQWEDASDGEQEGSDDENDSRGDEKKDSGKDDSPTTSLPRSRPSSAGSPKEQRTPRPKVHIPPPSAASLGPSEAGKPVSPFSPLDGHQPVSDWGEEMEMLSPRSSMGGESSLKPPSAENSPAQKKEEAEDTTTVEGDTAAPATPEKAEVQRAVIVSEPESTPADSLETPPSSSEVTPSEVSEPAALEVSEDNPETTAPDSQDKADSPPPAVLVTEAAAAAEAGRDDDNDTNGDHVTDTTTTSEIPPQQPTSG